MNSVFKLMDLFSLSLPHYLSEATGSRLAGTLEAVGESNVIPGDH